MRIYDIWAEWCPPCKRFAPIFESVAKDFPEHEFIKINADENGKFLADFGIKSIPTILFVDSESGQVLFGHIGILPKNSFSDLIRRVDLANRE